MELLEWPRPGLVRTSSSAIRLCHRRVEPCSFGPFTGSGERPGPIAAEGTVSGGRRSQIGPGKSRRRPGVAAAMPDYGHELQFGSFLTPSNRDPQAVVALAQAAERAGLDLVTFQDHPYQPRFLDTWTLLSYVAART